MNYDILKKYVLILFLSFSFVACDDDDETSEDAVQKVVEMPTSYEFKRDGQSTVSFSGQTTRLLQAIEIYNALKDKDKTEAEIKKMFNDGEGFSESALNGTGKKLGNKTGAYGASTVKLKFDDWIVEATGTVFPAVKSNTDAAAGVAGTYTDTGGSQRSVMINGKGHEINQLFTKGLMGALVCDQIIYGYLSKTKLDGGTNIADNDADKKVDGKTYTTMEHYWDEGFGYLYGLDTDISNATIEGTGILVDKYLKKVAAADGSLPGIDKTIHDAFKLGRAAIVAKDYKLRDEQALIIKENLSKVIGRKAADYLRSGAKEITDGNWANAHHALSEGYGFILSLQYTMDPATGAPHYSNTQVKNMLDTFDSGNGFWDQKPDDLIKMAGDIETTFKFQ